MHPELLLCGPRGRRLLLAYALESDRAGTDEYDVGSFWAAFFNAAHNLDPGRGISRVWIRSDGSTDEPPAISPAETARRLASVELADVTPVLLRSILADAVDNARYWQEPDGEDVLAATAPIRAELQRLAEKIAQSPHARGWIDPVQPDNQWSIQWDESRWGDEPAQMQRSLAAWREGMLAAEARAQREWPADPTVNMSGEWWSIPEMTLPRSNRLTFDGCPAGLCFVEDSLGFERATVSRLLVPGNVRVYEVDSAEAWAELCRCYPLEVTATKRHDWYRTTGRAGRWVMPDWSLVAEAYDGVHLTVAAYLAAVGIAIPVDEERASVIAGWNPDETWWLTDVTSMGESAAWVLETLPDHSRHWVQL